jgi:hypothetical protein
VNYLRFDRVILIAGALAMINACSKDTTTADNQVSMEQQTAADVSVSHIEIGRNVDADKRVTDVTKEFRPGETVYASVLTNGAAQNAEMMVRWTYQDGQIVDETVQTISPTGSAATEFHITKPEGLPTGKYRVEVFVNGKSAGVEEFEVKTA